MSTSRAGRSTVSLGDEPQATARAEPADRSSRQRAPLPELDAVVLSWLSAFAAAERALHSNSRQLGPGDAGTRLHRLRVEREEVTALLESLAHGRPSAELLVRCLGSPVIDIRLLGLPRGVTACIFDLEGVLTTSPELQRAAWSATLDTFLLGRAERRGMPFIPFDPSVEYASYLAGKPRLIGLRGLLASRGISLPDGELSDPPGAETIHGLANRKQEVLRSHLAHRGVEAFAGSLAYLQLARLVGARRAVVSASTNATLVLQEAGIAELIEEQVDGVDCEAESLDPSPAPDMLLAASARLKVDPSQAAAFETTPAGIAAARAGGFRAAIAVARHEGTSALAASDADLVVNDLGELLQRSVRR